MKFLSHWLSENIALLTAVVALIQAATAVIIVFLTRRLADLTQASLDVASREWIPNIHLKLHHINGAPRLRVFNLSRNAVQVTFILLRGERAAPRAFQVDMPILGAQADDSSDITPYIVDLVRQYLTGPQNWTGLIMFQVILVAAGSIAPRLIDPEVTYNIVIQGGAIIEMNRIQQAAAGTPTEAFE